MGEFCPIDGRECQNFGVLPGETTEDVEAVCRYGFTLAASAAETVACGADAFARHSDEADMNLVLGAQEAHYA